MDQNCLHFLTYPYQILSNLLVFFFHCTNNNYKNFISRKDYNNELVENLLVALVKCCQHFSTDNLYQISLLSQELSPKLLPIFNDKNSSLSIKVNMLQLKIDELYHLISQL